MIQTTELKKNLQAGAYDDVLLDIYVDADVLPYQKERYVAAIETYEKLYGADAVEIYSAPASSGDILRSGATKFAPLASHKSRNTQAFFEPGPDKKPCKYKTV